jgi:hypothetical protein
MQFDRLELLMKQQGKTKKHMGEIVGKGGYYIKDCKTKGIQVPETIVRVWANDLNTTYEYLMGTDEPQRIVIDVGASSTDFARTSKFNELYQQIAEKKTAEADLAELERFMEYLVKRGE